MLLENLSIDWGFAGAYPPAFEQATIAYQYMFPEFNRMIPDVLPKREMEVQQLLSISYALSFFTLAWR